MTTSYVGNAFAQSTSVTLPTHQSGDLIIGFASRITSSTAPSVPAGWYPILIIGGLGSRVITVAYKVAASASEVSGTWTNAELLGVGVWRDSVNYLIPGAVALSTTVSSTTVTYTAIDSGAGVAQRGSNWVAGFCEVASNSLAAETAPTGMTNRGSLAGSGIGLEIAFHDSNGNTSWATSQTAALGGTMASVGVVVELANSGIALAGAGGSGLAKLINGGLVRGQVI